MISESDEFTDKDVAAHNTCDDCWVIIQGDVYNVTKYVYDHPGGSDVLAEVAGKDATVDFDNAGHSEDAFEIMKEYRVGKRKGAPQRGATKPVTIQTKSTPPPTASKSRAVAFKAGATAVVMSLGGAALHPVTRLAILNALPRLRSTPGGPGFVQGVLLASVLFAVAGAIVAKSFSKLVRFEGANFMKYPLHTKMGKDVRPNPLLQRGWLDSTTYYSLPLMKKELVAPCVYRFTFELPTPQTVLGLPIGQHVTIKADIDGKSVSRPYTPTSNNTDLGIMQLVIKCYPDGQMTGGYLAKLEEGNEVLFRGPKGSMRYQRGLCKKIGMLAGGTGITPMFQLIRAICEDDRDVTEISLVYANRTEPDILLRAELEAFMRRYPQNLKIYFLLDHPPEHWAYGAGFATKEIIAERLPEPGPDTKIMLCGPPGMVNGAKKSLDELGFQKPGAMPRMTDQVFCF